MDTKEQDIQKHNLESIDMECDFCDDDDFGGKVVEFKPTATPQNMRTISADFNNGNLEITKTYGNSDMDNIDTGANLRSIDMECNCCDDDDDFGSFKTEISTSKSPTSSTEFTAKGNFSTNSPKYYGYKADFSDAEDDYTISDKSDSYDSYELQEKEDEPELVITERKGDYIDQGTIENNYLDKLTKKHKKSNVKGSYNSYFHLAGNPEKEMHMFNHDMGSDLTSVSSAGNITGTASTGSEGASCGESLNSTSRKNLFENLLVLIGFDIIPQEDKYIVKDKYDLTPEIECNSKEEAMEELQPYIDDMIITPLQATTGKDFKKPEEWVNWYTDENKELFPQCNQDIDYCKCLCKECNDEINK